jgi:XrtJ-associated TM-motif-TM protein
MRKTFVFAVVALALVCPVLHAQGGCVDSPEAPTDVLMLIGAVGMTFGSSVVMKIARKRRS